MKKYKDWELLECLPEGWKIDKTVGSPLYGYEFCTNGKSVFTGQKRALVKVISEISSRLNNKLEDLFIEGLKRKGFEFENRMELENFIKSNCRCEDRTDIKQRIYFVNDIPFFLHYYEVEMDLNPIQTDMGIKILDNYGHYAYL